MIARLATLALLFASSQALPNQPGSCSSPDPTGDSHRRTGAVGGTALSNSNIQVSIGGTVLNPSTTFSFNANKDLEIKITSTGGKSFAGFLVKLYKSGVDTTSYLDVPAVNSPRNVQILSLCTTLNAASLSHTNNNAKTSVSGILNVDKGITGLTMEVTAVIRNNGQGSEYYLSSFKLDSKVATGGFGCFPGDATVLTEGRGPVFMKDIQLGDQVLVDNDKYEPVYSFGHSDAQVSAEYVQLKTSSTKLDLSNDHMLFIESGAAVPASTIKVGDKVILASGELETVEGISQVQRKGVFAPFTPSGTIVVNGIKASSFIAFQDSDVLQIGGVPTGLSFQWLAHTFEFPHRMWCAYYSSSSTCHKEQYINGVSTWVATPHDMARWFVKQNAVIMALISIPLVAAFGSLWMASVMMAYPLTLIAILFAARSFFTIRNAKTKKIA